MQPWHLLEKIQIGDHICLCKNVIYVMAARTLCVRSKVVGTKRNPQPSAPNTQKHLHMPEVTLKQLRRLKTHGFETGKWCAGKVIHRNMRGIVGTTVTRILIGVLSAALTYMTPTAASALVNAAYVEKSIVMIAQC